MVLCYKPRRSCTQHPKKSENTTNDINTSKTFSDESNSPMDDIILSPMVTYHQSLLPSANDTNDRLTKKRFSFKQYIKKKLGKLKMFRSRRSRTISGPLPSPVIRLNASAFSREEEAEKFRTLRSLNADSNAGYFEQIRYREEMREVERTWLTKLAMISRLDFGPTYKSRLYKRRELRRKEKKRAKENKDADPNSMFGCCNGPKNTKLDKRLIPNSQKTFETRLYSRLSTDSMYPNEQSPVIIPQDDSVETTLDPVPNITSAFAKSGTSSTTEINEIDNNEKKSIVTRPFNTPTSSPIVGTNGADIPHNADAAAGGTISSKRKVSRFDQFAKSGLFSLKNKALPAGNAGAAGTQFAHEVRVHVDVEEGEYKVDEDWTQEDEEKYGFGTGRISPTSPSHNIDPETPRDASKRAAILCTPNHDPFNSVWKAEDLSLMLRLQPIFDLNLQAFELQEEAYECREIRKCHDELIYSESSGVITPEDSEDQKEGALERTFTAVARPLEICEKRVVDSTGRTCQVAMDEKR